MRPFTSTFLLVLAVIATSLLPVASVGAIIPSVPDAPPPGMVALAVPNSVVIGYATPVLPVPVGGALTFYNYDFSHHNIVAETATGSDDQFWCRFYDAGECPLFWSPLVTFQGSGPVHGLDRIEGGAQYAYFCSVHPWMKGTLIGVPAVA